MADFWEHNLELLKIHLPAVHDWAVQHPDRPPDPNHPPCEFDAEEWYAALTALDWYIGLLFGFGDGEHVERLVVQYPDRALTVLEPEPDAFLRACHDRDLAVILAHPELQVLLIHKPNARLIAHQLFQNMREFLNVGRVVTLNWPPSEQRHLSFWQELHARITELIKQDATNTATYRRYSLGWQRNVWDNLPYALTDPGVGCLFDAFRDRPAILVASGPSLAKNIHLLREAKGHALIVAAGSGIEPLHKAGIVPDLVISFDASEQNAEPFIDLDMPTLPLVYSGIIHPPVVSGWQGPRFVMNVDMYPFESWLYRQLSQDKGEVSSGPSVANVSWDLLMRMGCDPIILVGQDLALTDGRTHADGVSAATAIDAGNPDVDYDWTDGIDGEPVLTTTVMLTMKAWFEQRILAWSDMQTQTGQTVQRTIDATEGGARIAGTELLTLREALDTHCPEHFDPAARLAALHHEHSPGPVDPVSLDTAKDTLRSALMYMSSLCDDGKQPVTQLQALSLNGVDGPSIFPLAQQLARLDCRLSGHEVYRQFLEPAMRQYANQYTVLSNQLRQETDPAKAAQALASLYSGYLADTKRMIEEIGGMF